MSCCNYTLVKKRNKFYLSVKTDELIDSYMTACQAKNFSEIQIRDNFLSLCKQIDTNEVATWQDTKEFNHDIDLLFKRHDNIYYVEVKYNDDHDTGKFENINRKFIKN